MVDKLYEIILIVRERNQIESVLKEAQCGFSSGKEFTDQIFEATQMGEKILIKSGEVYWAIMMDLMKAYVDRDAMW